MRKAFQMFDTQKSGFIETLRLKTILNSMGQMFEESELQDLIDENDPEDTGKVNFDGFCNIAAHFLEEEDAEAIQKELKEAFRLYDREGNGYITTSTLKEILAALDDKLSSGDLDGIIAEIDTDGSGTVDFDGNLWNISKSIKSNHSLIRSSFYFRIYGNDDGRLKRERRERESESERDKQRVCVFNDNSFLLLLNKLTKRFS